MESTSRGLIEPLRCDLALPRLDLARSRSHAKELIDNGSVFVTRDGKERAVTAASFMILPTDRLRVESSELTRFVSRAGAKLDAAISHLGLDVRGFRCLDVGQSTGGFTDCLLKRGAAHVTGIDVGRDQLDAALRTDPRVSFYQELNARDASWIDTIAASLPEGGYDLAVVDVSFISLTYVLPAIADARLGRPRLLALVKPQFEVGPQGLDDHGVVKDPSLLEPVRDKVTASVRERGWKVVEYFSSDLRGKDGNREFFIYAEKI